jgi:voltage-gated potassium channel
VIDRHSTEYRIFIEVLSLLSLLALVVMGLGQISPEVLVILEVADTAVCLLFFCDFLVTLWQADHRLKYLATWGWIDLLSSIPTVNWLRLGRLARITRLFRMLRVVKAARVVTESVLEHRAKSALLSVVLLSFVCVVVGSILVLHFEVGHGGPIQTGEEALWRAFTTVTTVGYGDYAPITGGGRIVAVCLMTLGIGVFATSSGLLASWFMTPPKARSHERPNPERFSEQETFE